MLKCSFAAFLLMVSLQLALLPIHMAVAQETEATTSRPQFKWAWELPYYGDNYEFARQYVWSEPNSVGEAYLASGITRTKDKGDEINFLGYAAFRPFAFDFGSFSLAFGVSYVGSVAGLEERDQSEFKTVGKDFLLFEASDIKAYSRQHAFNFSTLASFPDLGLQLIADIGYSWPKIEAKFDNSATLLNQHIFSGIDYTPVKMSYNDYHYMERDEGIYLSLEIRKFFDRNYFNFISLIVFGNYKLNTRARKSEAEVDLIVINPFNGQPIPASYRNLGRVRFPSRTIVFQNTFLETPIELQDPQNGNFDTSTVGAALTMRLVNIPLDLPGLFEGQGISLDALGGLEHGAGELFEDDFHGLGMTLGGQVSLFNVVLIGATYTWQRGNDQADEWNLVFMIGVNGQLSSSSKSSSPTTKS